MFTWMLAIDAHLAVRMLHVVSATIAVGVPVGLALVMRRRPPADTVERLVGDAERLQWLALALLVATGVGNLAAFEGDLPEFGSDWGRVFIVKMAAVFALLVISAIRTFVIAAQRMSTADHQRLSMWYAATAATGVIVVVLAQVLAHA